MAEQFVARQETNEAICLTAINDIANLISALPKNRLNRERVLAFLHRDKHGGK